MPVTTAGRILGVGLMVGGIAIVGTTTALVVSVLGEQLKLRRDELVPAGTAGTPALAGDPGVASAPDVR